MRPGLRILTDPCSTDVWGRSALRVVCVKFAVKSRTDCVARLDAPGQHVGRGRLGDGRRREHGQCGQGGRGAHQFRLHAPGPRGSPHVPQPPAGTAGSRGPDDETAKTESCLSSAWLRHDGQAGAREAVTSVSNCW